MKPENHVQQCECVSPDCPECGGACGDGSVTALEVADSDGESVYYCEACADRAMGIGFAFEPCDDPDAERSYGPRAGGR